VLDDGTSDFNMAEFKALLENRLQQRAVLIVARAVTLI
jgi:hypothetical protein